MIPERYTCISILQEVRRMSDMMKMFVEQELQNQIKENYPHMQYPPGKGGICETERRAV